MYDFRIGEKFYIWSEYCNRFGIYQMFLRIPLGTRAKQLNDTHGEKLCFLRGFIEMEARLLLIFFICLHNQLSSIHFIVTH